MLKCHFLKGKLINGLNLASCIHADLKIKVSELYDSYKVIPKLAVLLNEDNRLVTNLLSSFVKQASDNVGVVHSEHFFRYKDSDATLQDGIDIIQSYNLDQSIHGILLQGTQCQSQLDLKLPLLIDPQKDVNGYTSSSIFHLMNDKKIMPSRNTFHLYDFHLPCTAQACIELLDALEIDLEGKFVTILGRSHNIGLPLSFMLIKRSATVTIVHSYSKNIPENVRTADIVIAAIGVPNFVQGSWLKEGAIVIDIGVNGIRGGVTGDVDFESAVEVASIITPVATGMLPITAAMVVRNTVYGCIRMLKTKNWIR